VNHNSFGIQFGDLAVRGIKKSGGSKIKFLKIERGSFPSPFQQNPIFTPFRPKPELDHHPGKT